MQNLKTDWKTIGSSGPTVDGRAISADVLVSAAKTYDPAFYTALMFPDHERMWAPSFGKIDSLRTVKNADGSISLQAIIVPNENYIYANRSGQYLYSSMELRPDFPKQGEYYLVGCAPTDTPASTRTEEIRFSSDSEPLMFGAHVELRLEDEAPKPADKTSLFKRLFGRPETQEESTVDKELADKIFKRLDALDAKFTAGGKPAETGADDGKNKGKDDKPDAIDPAQYAALEKERDELKAKVAELEKKDTDTQGQFKAVQDEVKALREEFKAALNTEAPGGTKSPANPGGGGSTKAFL
ncbi:GPO family capsid scaffolding protein [Methylomagnum ishizawai]|uniref:GPO family capsid scaffolding protein n=1 Tax=Methylomagnum ishizawai TaxID=1760988 RepID=UPI001C32583B|nr:GPO family capsid scaffolding protein [Methylomagnum ishizawai]BBL73980.1 phage capsid scaffolding protein [Methylomagnum ishizawai]